MTDLAAWLLEQIGADEAAAKAAKPGPWRWDDPHFDGEPKPATCDEWGHDGPDLIDAYAESVITSNGYDADHVIISRPDATHIVRWDPARVLAECAARRQLIELHAGEHPCVYTDKEWGRNSGLMQRCDTLRLLAQPLADRPGFDASWRLEHIG